MSIKRLNYATGQFLTATDFQIEQLYHKGLRRLHNKCMHTPGVAGGLDVTKSGDTQVSIAPGLAIDANGAELALLDPATVDLSSQSSQQWVLLTAVYGESNVDPGKAGTLDTFLHCAEQPTFGLVAVASATALPASDGFTIPLALLHFSSGKLDQIISTPPARQLAGSRLDPTASLVALKVAGDTSLAGMAVSGAASFAGAASFGGVNASGDLAIGGQATFNGAAAVAGQLSVAGVATVGENQPLPQLRVGNALANVSPGVPTVVIGNPNGSTSLLQGKDGGNNVEFSWLDPNYARIAVAAGKPLVLQDNAVGNVGIGNTNPQGMLHIGSSTTQNPNIFLSGNTVNGENGLRVHYNHDPGAMVGVIDIKGGAFAIRGEAGAGNGSTERFYLDLNTGNVGIGTTGPVAKLHIAGASVTVEGSTAAPYQEQAYLSGESAGVRVGSRNRNIGTVNIYNTGSATYMDLVCKNLYATKVGYVVDQFVNASGELLSEGDVVIISRNQVSVYYGPHDVPVPEVDLSSAAYDTKVCGIVADAQAVSAHELRPLPNAEQYGGPPPDSRQVGHMATLGAFVQCKVDADIAAIEVGDLLTTSPTPGHAQKVVDRSLALGAIIGKALAPLAGGRGKIPVMVTLQ